MLSSPARLGRLSDLHILDTPADAHFDALTRLTAHVMRAPQAFINFVDEARTWCKSAWGAARAVRVHAESLCAMAIQGSEDVVIYDATRHEGVKGHPEFAGDDPVVFYMAFILRSPDGFALGTLCVKDVTTRTLEPFDVDALRLLGELVTLLLAQEVVKHQTTEAAQRNRDQFLAMLAHELRAPMSPVLTAVQVLNRFKVSAVQRKRAKDMIARHVRHMGQLVDHLLSTSLVSLGTIEMHLEPVRVSELLDQAIEMTGKNIEQRHHRLTRSDAGDLWVFADRVQCPLILVNLLLNAAKYTPENGQIDIQATGDGSLLRIAVKDTGIGIEQGDLDEIFQVFGQTHRNLDRTDGGMGLGLSLARRLAQWHGGTLDAYSEGVGKGSEFVLVLKQAHATDTVTPENRIQEKSTRALDLLVIDDNADTADALALYFQMSDHTVRTAYRSADALALFAERQPDVVLSDIGLPGVDGFELIRKMRQRMRSLNAKKPTIFVAITGYGSVQDRQAAFDAGFDQHFSKPVELRKLDSILEELSTLSASSAAKRSS